MPPLPLRTAPGRRSTARAGVVGLAVLASAVLGVGPAGAAGPVTVPLDPTDVTIYLDGVENHSASDPVSEEEFVFTPLPAAWGGQVVLQLPDRLDGSAMDVHLDLSPDAESESTRSYSTTTPGSDGLVVSSLGSGRYGVTLPPDDGHGPVAWLWVEGITSSDGYDVVPSPEYRLELSSDAPVVVELEPQLVAIAAQPCPVTAATRCPTSTVTAGTSFALTVPPTSALRVLDAGTLETAHVSLTDLSGYGFFGQEPLELSDDPALFSASGPWDATVTLPGGVRAGDHFLSVSLGDPASGGAVAIVEVELHVLPVQAPPVATPPTATPTTTPSAISTPQPVVLNAGLRSNTGVTVAASGSGGSATVAAGAGLLLLSGVGGATVVRARRRRSATSAGVVSAGS